MDVIIYRWPKPNVSLADVWKNRPLESIWFIAWNTLLYLGNVCSTQRSLDKVFYWFLKILLNVKRNISNVMLVGDVGMFPRNSLCHRNILLYFIRLNNLPPDSVVKFVFLESKRLCELGHWNWYTKAWELAQSYNLDDSNATKHLIKSTVTAKYESDWHVKLQDIKDNPI